MNKILRKIIYALSCTFTAPTMKMTSPNEHSASVHQKHNAALRRARHKSKHLRYLRVKRKERPRIDFRKGRARLNIDFSGGLFAAPFHSCVRTTAAFASSCIRKLMLGRYGKYGALPTSQCGEKNSRASELALVLIMQSPSSSGDLVREMEMDLAFVGGRA